MTRDELMKCISSNYAADMNTEFGEVLITAGAGDIDVMVEPIKKLLEKYIT